MAEVKPDKSDRKRVTLREVAQEAGVSLKTASNVINHSGRMADATREKVQDVIDRLGYRVNVSARNLNRGQQPASSRSRCRALIRAIFGRTGQPGDRRGPSSTAIPCTSPRMRKDPRRVPARCCETSTATVSDGMILSISEVEDLDPEDLDVDYPLVMRGRAVHAWGMADHVTPDDVPGGASRRRQYLFDHGATNLAVIGLANRSGAYPRAARRRGRQRAAAHARHHSKRVPTIGVELDHTAECPTSARIGPSARARA